jgi:hypothetical protein
MSRLAERAPARPAPRSAWRDAWPPILAGAALVVAYVLVYPLFDLRVTIGSDASVYAWWARVGGALGMGPLGTGARPGSVGLVATLARVTGAPAAVVVAATIPALAAATGLAAGALSEVALGADRRRFFLVTVLSGSFLTLLADGYLSTFAFLSAFVAALACMTVSLRSVDPAADRDALASKGPGAIMLAAGLTLAAGLGHPLFLAVAAVVVAGGIVGILPETIRAAHTGTPFWSTGAARVGAAGLGGAALVPVGLAMSGGFATSSVVTSRDAVLREMGRASQVRSSYVRKLTHDFPWYRALVLGSAATPLLVRADAGRAWATERARFLWGLAVAWVAVAVGGVLLLVAGASTPGQRLAATCVALPLLAGVGLAAMWRRRAGAWRAAAAVGAVLFLVLAWSRWIGERPLDSASVVAGAQQAALALAGAPPGTPLVVVMDDRSASPTIRAVRYLNDLRGQVAPGDAGRVFVFLGTPEDFLASRPTLTGQPEYDAYSRSSLDSIRSAGGRPLVLVVRAFDPRAFGRARSLPDATRAGPGVVALPGSPPTAPVSSSDATGAGPQSPWAPVWEAILVLAIACAVGWPYTAMLPHMDGRLRWALAPALGIAALMVASVVVDGIGVRLSDTNGWLAPALAVVPAWGLMIWMHRRPAAA